MEANDEIKFLKENINQLYVIHYSCESLNDGNESYSPRITSIAVLNYSSSNLKSFSIHLIAEVKKISKDQIENQYDVLEAIMLEEFYSFIRDHQSAYWLHWNMKNITYGFESIEHRYHVLTNKLAPVVSESNKYNLSAIITEINGKNYVDIPRILNLMKLNGGRHRDCLEGLEEVDAFKRQQYIKLHRSTMCKVYFFQKIFRLLLSGGLKIKSKPPEKSIDIHSMLTSKYSLAIGLIAAFITIYYFSADIYQKYNNSLEEVNQVTEITKPNKIQSPKNGATGG